MQKYTTDAINLKSYTFNENDKVMVMYSKEKGLIRAVAKGVNNYKNALSGRMETLVANKLLVAKGQNLDKIYQAEAVDTFSGIRKDITKLSYSMYVSELINMFGIEEDANSCKIYNLFFDFLNKISSVKNQNAVLWNVLKFQLRFMQELGYGIELDTCVKCGKEITSSNLSLCAISGGVICDNCIPASKQDYNIKSALKKAMETDFTESLYLSNKELMERCFNFLNSHIAKHCNKKIKSSEILACLS
jgi:DNA repair protein RecO (recombination protein O)